SAGHHSAYTRTRPHPRAPLPYTTLCRSPTVTATAANLKITTTPANHIPTGSLNCNGSGCHSTTNVSAGGFNIGSASIASPSLTVAGDTTVAAATPACLTCHEAPSYLGML